MPTATTPMLPRNTQNNQPRRSKFEITKLAFNATALGLISILAITDGLRSLFVAQNAFDETANALRGNCDPASASHKIFAQTCANLTIGESATRDVANNQLSVTRMNATAEEVITNPAVKHFTSILFQKLWFSTLVCHRPEENKLQIVGSAYHGGSKTRELAKTGFPIYNETTDVSPNFIVDDRNANIMAAVALGAIAFCKLVQEGGEHASIPGQYTNGFEDSFTSTFQNYMYFLIAFCVLASYVTTTNTISAVRNLFFRQQAPDVELEEAQTALIQP